MDTLKEISELINSLPAEIQSRINAGVSQHISRSEYHFAQARIKKDDQYFTDAVYRTNQAYEGILREAYEILANKTANNIKTYIIEKYFEDNNVFNSRVKNIFINYRQEWRNPSTHDHKLFFKKDEAFLAIVNVSAFIFILLNQIVSKVSYTTTKDVIKKDVKIDNVLKKMPDDSINGILYAFLEYTKYIKNIKITGINESQIIGNLIAFLEEILVGFKLIAEYEVTLNRAYCDLLIKKENHEPVVVEIKSRFDKKNLVNALNQVSSYLELAKFKIGILFFYSDKQDVTYQVEEEKIADNVIYVFIPYQNKSPTIAST